VNECAGSAPVIEPRIILKRMKRTALLLLLLAAAVPVFADHRRAVFPSAPGCAEAIVAAPYAANDFAVDADFLYFTDDLGGLFRIPKSGGSTPATVAQRPNSQIISIAVDAQKVYFVSVNDFTGMFADIYSVAKTGGTPALLVSQILTPFQLLVDDQNLYWNSLGTDDGEDVMADGKIEKLRKDGTGRLALASDLSYPLSIALDGDNVLFGETGLGLGDNSAGLRSVPKAGGTITNLTDGAPVVGIAPGPSAIYFGSVSLTSLSGTINAFDRSTKIVTELASAPGSLPFEVQLSGDQVYYYLLSDVDSINAVPAAGDGPSRTLRSGSFTTPEFVVDGCALYYGDLDNDTFLGSVRRSPR